MAPFGVILKNSILFLIITAGITYISSQLIMIGLYRLVASFDNIGTNYDDGLFSDGVSNLWLGLLILIGGIGIFYMKALSDSVEEGMIEF